MKQIASAEAALAPQTEPNPASVLTCSRPTLERPPAASTNRTSALPWTFAKEVATPNKYNNVTDAMMRPNQMRIYAPMPVVQSTTLATKQPSAV
jgi:hypothetical protein